MSAMERALSLVADGEGVARAAAACDVSRGALQARVRRRGGAMRMRAARQRQAAAALEATRRLAPRDVTIWSGPAGETRVAAPARESEVARFVREAALWRLPLDREAACRAALEQRLQGPGLGYVCARDWPGRPYLERSLRLAAALWLDGAKERLRSQLRRLSEAPEVAEIVLLTPLGIAAPPPLGARAVSVTVVDLTGGWM